MVCYHWTPMQSHWKETDNQNDFNNNRVDKMIFTTIVSLSYSNTESIIDPLFDNLQKRDFSFLAGDTL